MFQTLLGNAALNSLTNIYGFQKALATHRVSCWYHCRTAKKK